MRFPFLRCGLALAALALFALAAAPSVQAQTIWIAVYGDNAIDDRINSGNPITGERYGLTNYQAVLVSAADITNGILQRTTNPFSAFVYTRPGNQPGPNLGGVAAQKVRDFVGSPATGMGNVVLLNGDFADALQAPMLGGGLFSDPNVERLIANAVIFAATPAGPGELRGHGFVGEYTGAIAGLTSNQETAPLRTALGFVEGHAGEIDFSGGNSDSNIFATSEGIGHPVLAGVPSPYNPTPGTLQSVEFGAQLFDVDPSLVLANWSSGDDANPAIIVSQGLPAVSSDTTAPTITASADKTTLWSPNGKLVPVTITGQITDNAGGSGVNPLSVAFTVVDEYDLVEPFGSVVPNPDGTYSFTVQLAASRLGSDADGRHYTIIMTARDLAGNEVTESVQSVVVPHDQGG